MGWQTHAASKPNMPIFDIGGLFFALYDRADLADYTGVSGFSQGNASVTLSHNVRGPDDVDQILERAIENGATQTRPPGKADWGGHIGVFADFDGHLWEIVWNPKWPIGGQAKSS